MDPQKRRQAILALLAASPGPITGTDLANRFGVTRTVIVQDIAILRAGDQPIIATPQGYAYRRGPAQAPGPTTKVAVRHGPDPASIRAELNAIVDAGATIRDVIVEHPIYGEMSGLLLIKSRHDVEEFCRRLTASGAAPLLTLTEGVHLHTLEADDPAIFQRVRRSLAALGMLLDD